MTLSLRSLPASAADPSKATYFNCEQIGHFTSSYLNPYMTLKINEIKQKDIKAFNDEANKENDIDSKLEN